MKMGRFAPISSMMLAAMFTLAVGHGLVLAPEARAQDDKDVLEGTWVNTIKIVNCDNRDIVFVTFRVSI